MGVMADKAVIDVRNLTLTYRSGRGVFDLDFSVRAGEVMGYLGPNGAGKTTTIRAILGFMKPDSGTCSINGLDCITNAPEIQRTLGYIPGEIMFPEEMNGDEFLKFMTGMRRNGKLIIHRNRQKELTDYFELDLKGRIRKFSKGMKQKLAIITAFMHDPDVLILDEPTSGLDPLMQNKFVELVAEEKKRGKTILMSSHLFEEVEKTCDNVLIIKDGRIVKQTDIHGLMESRLKKFVIRAADTGQVVKLLQSKGFDARPEAGGTIEVLVKGGDIDIFIKTLSGIELSDLNLKTQTLEDVFLQFYGRSKGGDGND